MKTLLLFLCRLAFRPKLIYASEKARLEALAQPRVLICNHVRGMDGAVIFSAMHGQQVTALAARDVMDTYPILRWLFRYLPVILLDRENVGLSWLRDSRRVLREGQHVMIFPEGKCNFQKVMQPFKPGAALLAASCGVKVTPVFHNGEYHYFFGRRFRVIVGEPIEVAAPPEGLTEAVLNAESGQFYAAMRDLEKQLLGFNRQ